MELSSLQNLPAEELQAYLQSLEASQDHIQSILNFARKLESERDYKRSILCAQWILSVRPGFIPAYILLGSNYLKSHNYHQLVASLEDAMVLEQGNPGQKELLRYIYCKGLLETQRFAEAESILFPHLEERENKPLWFSILELDVLEHQGYIDRLLDLLDTKIKFYPDNKVFIIRKLGTLNKQGKFLEAYNQISNLLEKDPKNVDLLHLKAKIDYENRDYLEAKLSYTRILEVENDIKAHLWIARVHTLEKDDELANYHLRTAVKLSDDDTDRFHCLNILSEIGRDDMIDELVEKWYGQQYLSPETYLSLSQVRVKQMKYDDAEEMVNKALEIKEDPRIYFELAKIKSLKKDFEKAEAILILNNILDHPQLAFFGRYEYCLIARRRKRYAESLQRFRDFSSMHPNNTQLKTEVVDMYLKLSMFTQAISYLKAEIEKNPSNMEVWRALINCNFQNQNYFEALSMIESYIEKFGKDEKVLTHQTACLREVGRYELCEKLLEEALELYPESFDLKISQAHFYRRLSSEFFFEKEKYHQKALEIHQSTQPAYAYQSRILNIEIINDLIHLNRYTDAMNKIDEFLEEREGHTEMYYNKVRVLSKMGSHKKAYAYIQELKETEHEDYNLMLLEAEELLSLDMWTECEALLKEIELEGQSSESLVLKVKLYLRQGRFTEAKESFLELVDVSPHHAFIHNELIDFGLSNPKVYFTVADKLGIKHIPGEGSLIRIYPKANIESENYLEYDFGSSLALSHIVIESDYKQLDGISVSVDGMNYLPINSSLHDLSYGDDHIVISGTFELMKLRVPLVFSNTLSFYSVYPVSTDGRVEYKPHALKKDCLFTVNIVETGLGDQLHYIRTASLIAESLGMEFAGFLDSQFEIARERVTEDPRLYDDLGFKDLNIKDDDYHIVTVPLKLTTRFIPAYYQWSSFVLFLEYINTLIDEALDRNPCPEGATTLVMMSVDDHNFTRLFARLFYPFSEPQTRMIQKLRKSFREKQENRTALVENEKEPCILLQCRLGDVANIPINYQGEEVWIIPFSGEVMKKSIANKYHMRYSNLEKIKEIGQLLSDRYGDRIKIKLITDGYDYGIEYLKEYKALLMEEMGVTPEGLDALKLSLAEDFSTEFGFVDEIVYGEAYDKLIRSIDLVTQSNVLISTNGQFTNEFKMSFSGDKESYLIVKKLYSNLRVARSSHTTELFWEIEGVDLHALEEMICSHLQRWSGLGE